MSLADAYPQFVPTAEELGAATAQIIDAYNDYVAHVSPPQMAISLETAAYIYWVAGQIKLKSAVDFGSGFTSWVLRQVCDDVWSVDDSPEWLVWTERFLERHDTKTDHLLHWDDYRTIDQSHNLVVYDFSSGATRDAFFQFAVGQLRLGGVGIMDDAMHQGHQTSMHKAARHFRYDLFGLQDWTTDRFHRFAALIVAP